MSMRALLLRDTATVFPYSDGADDGLGNKVPSFGAGVVYPAWADQIGQVEDTAGRDTRITQFRVVLGPEAVSVSALDEIEVMGHRCRIVGEPTIETNHFGGIHHLALIAEYGTELQVGA